jgi:hypothetical protein
MQGQPQWCIGLLNWGAGPVSQFSKTNINKVIQSEQGKTFNFVQKVYLHFYRTSVILK